MGVRDKAIETAHNRSHANSVGDREKVINSIQYLNRRQGKIKNTFLMLNVKR
jgi:hypothetical protein